MNYYRYIKTRSTDAQIHKMHFNKEKFKCFLFDVDIIDDPIFTLRLRMTVSHNSNKIIDCFEAVYSIPSICMLINL